MIIGWTCADYPTFRHDTILCPYCYADRLPAGARRIRSEDVVNRTCNSLISGETLDSLRCNVCNVSLVGLASLRQDAGLRPF